MNPFDAADFLVGKLLLIIMGGLACWATYRHILLNDPGWVVVYGVFALLCLFGVVFFKLPKPD